MKKIILALLVAILLLVAFNFPLSFEGSQGHKVYTITAYNIFHVQLYDYVIE